MRRYTSILLLTGSLLGCATVVEQGSASLPDPWVQTAVSDLLDAGAREVTPHLAGGTYRVDVTPPDAFFSRYARIRLEQAVREAGGQVSPDAGTVVAFAVRAAGSDRAERSFVLPVGQYLRMPLYYGQDVDADLAARISLIGPQGSRTWDLSGRKASRTSYAFRVLGPF